MAKAVVFFPQNPLPAQCGFHRRGLEILSALREVGFHTVLASSNLSAAWSSPTWNQGSVSALQDRYVSDVRLHEVSSRDRRIVDVLTRGYRRFRRDPPLSTRINTPPGMRKWFADFVDAQSPDLVLMNYVLWDGLVDHRRWRSIRRVVDTIDLITLNQRMWRALKSVLPAFPVDPRNVSESVADPHFFTNLSIDADAAEFRIHDRYDFTISITEQERRVIAEATSRTNVVHIPMTFQVHHVANSYSGPALFTTGPNPFNIQGYVFFFKRVLPKVLDQLKDFSLQVTGSCSTNVKGGDGITLSGFVDDLTSLYTHARFAVCPVFGLTGQQVKIVEAMAHGVPVIALEAAALRSPIEHGVNGLVARDASEFAEYVVRLWRNPDLCRRLGGAARDTIRANFSPERLRTALAAIVP